jgi:hypothetical protein
MKATFKLLGIIIFPFIIGLSIPDAELPEWPELAIDINPGHLDGAFTGGFGEQTCHSCHFDYELNMEGGSLSLQGVPDTYDPGSSYELIVVLKSEILEVGGFQLTTRFEDGRQAGAFSWEGDRLTYTPAVTDSIKYLQHSAEGTAPVQNRKTSWTFTWSAPEAPAGDVIINIAANSGNDDDSAFGDWIYVKEIIVESDQH